MQEGEERRGRVGERLRYELDDRRVFGGIGGARTRTERHAKLSGRTHRSVVGGYVIAAQSSGAPSQRNHRLDGLDDESGRCPARKRTDMQTLLGRILGDDQSRPFLVDGQSHVAVLVARGAGLVVLRHQALNQSHFENLGGQCIGSRNMVDAVHLAQQRADFAACFRGTEITADPLAKVGGLADVQNSAGDIGEDVDTRGSRQILGQS